MKKGSKISLISSIVGILLVAIGLFTNVGSSLDSKISASGLATSVINVSNNSNNEEKGLFNSSVKMETADADVYRVEVYEGLTIDELSAKLNRVLGGVLSGKGELIANKCLELGVDPYVAVAIMLLETGNGTSRISTTCYNVGGQKGSGCGSYQAFGSIDEGITGMISNLNRNFYSKGLTTVETIGPRYAESDTWVSKINGFINKIRAA